MIEQPETLLRQLARDRGLLSYRAFVAAYEAAARDIGLGGMTVTERQYMRWLAGNVRTAPLPDARRILRKLFGAPVEQLLQQAPSATVEPSDPDVLDLSHSMSVVWTTRPQRPPRADHRPGSPTLQELMMSAAENSRNSAEQAEAMLGPSTLEALQDDVAHLARTYLQTPPAKAFPRITGLRDQVEEKIGQTRQPDQLRELGVLNSVLCALLAEACIDLGEPRMAGEHARAAWAHANTIGHTDLAVWARGIQATSNYWNDRPNDALVAVRRGEEHRPTGVAAARLNSIKARTWSHLGNSEETLRAVRDAQDARASVGSGPDDLSAIGGVFTWDQAREERCVSTALLQLVEGQYATLDPAALHRFTHMILTHAEQALAVARALPAEQQSPIIQATIILDIATAMLLRGDVPGAHEALRPVLALPENMRTFPVMYRLGVMKTPLGSVQQTRATRELQDALVGFAARSAVQALPPGGAS